MTVNGREIGIYNLGGEYFALLNRCPHEAGPLCRGNVVGWITSDGPGDFKTRDATNWYGARGTAGATTSGPASRGAIRKKRACGATR